MIIFLGFDNTGKTTTAQTIAGHFSKEFRTSSGKGDFEYQKDWFKEQIDHEEKFRKGLANEVVYDRFNLFEEQVYGPVLRGVSNFSLDSSYIDTLNDYFPTIVYCRPPNSTIFNFGDREQMEGVIDNKQKLLMAYDELVMGLVSDPRRQWNIFIYDFTKKRFGSYVSLVNSIQRDIKIREEM